MSNLIVTNINGAAPEFPTEQHAYNQTGTPALRSSVNVSSMTDNSTGSYLVNFTNNKSAATYRILMCSESTTATNDSTFAGGPNTDNFVPTTSQYRIDYGNRGGAVDLDYQSGMTFGANA